MRATQYYIPSLKEVPSEAELVSHQLMLRAGLIRKLASGIYTWLPLGLKVLRKVEQIIREEMNATGALEIVMPNLQPAELWQQTNRWDQYGAQLLKIKDRNDRDFCYGPTHEEIVTDLLRHDLRSYKQLPVTLYQIQTKFRDEIRPRFGIMRAREFIMKDAYSFHLDSQSMQETYQVMYQAYSNIFTKLGLSFRAVEADSGDIGGDCSHEFQVLAESGEDLIAYSSESDYAANIERAKAPTLSWPDEALQTKQLITTPNCKTVDAVKNFLNVDSKRIVKTLFVIGVDTPLVALCLRGDHKLSTVKAENHPLIAKPLTFANDEAIEKLAGSVSGFCGPIGLTLPIIIDNSVANMKNFICGANQIDHHYQQVNWQQDATYQASCDLREIEENDVSPCGKGSIKFAKGIEVGHIFQLGDKYAKPLKLSVLDQNGIAQTLLMGCYGIGVSRIVAAAIEQNHDGRGIKWPTAMSPFDVMLIPMNYHKSERLKQATDALYEKLKTEYGLDVLLLDQKERPGVLFSIADLIGVTHQVILSDKNLDEQTYEYKNRHKAEQEFLTLDNLLAKLIQ